MSARAFLRDGGGVPRLAKRPFIRDSGGVARQAKRIFIRDAGGVARLVYAGGYSGTLTAGVDGYMTGYGYPSYGSMVPTTDYQGNTINALAANESGSDGTEPVYLQLTIQGTSAAPPPDYFTTLNINGSTFLASQAQYSVSGNYATWTWSGTVFGFVSGDTYPVSYD